MQAVAKTQKNLQAAVQAFTDAQKDVAADALLADYLDPEEESVRVDDALQHVEQQQQSAQG